jgi:hypothetical protein
MIIVGGTINGNLSNPTNNCWMVHLLTGEVNMFAKMKEARSAHTVLYDA